MSRTADPGFRTAGQLAAMREGGLLLFRLFRDLAGIIRPGLRGTALEDWCSTWCRARGLETVLKGYQGFPAHICLNPGAVAAHGIPDAAVLAPGSLCTVDLAVRYRGFCLDAAWTYALPPVAAETGRLRDGAWCTTARACLAVLQGASHAQMGQVCRDEAGRHGLCLMKRFGGHGIGREIHEPPRFDHWGSLTGVDFARPGLALSLEPVLGLGGDGVVEQPDGSWVTADGSWCAQFEHNLAPGTREQPGTCLTLPDLRLLRLPSPPF